MCPVCGLLYVRELEEDRRVHRARHREVLQVYEPKPDPRLSALYAEHGNFMPLDSRSPHWLRNRLGSMAMMFQRELGFDFPPYSAAEDDPTPSRHWLIVTADGRSIGGLSARWREYSDASARWVWAWVWVIPSERRAGHAPRCWTMLKAKLPEVEPEPPYSYPIAKFFAARTDVADYVREHAIKRLAQTVDDVA
jgi:acetyltransferase ESCO-like protein